MLAVMKCGKSAKLLATLPDGYSANCVQRVDKRTKVAKWSLRASR
jgi:hypothetical protein